MDMNHFEQTKDIRQRVMLAAQAAKEMPENLSLHAQISDQFLSDILQICFRKAEDDTGKEHLYEELKKYYASWNHDHAFQSVLLACAGVRREDRDFFLRSSLEEYKSYLLRGTGDGINAVHTEMVSEEPEYVIGLSETKTLSEETILAYREGALGFQTLYQSFKGWLLFKLKKGSAPGNE